MKQVSVFICLLGKLQNVLEYGNMAINPPIMFFARYIIILKNFFDIFPRFSVHSLCENIKFVNKTLHLHASLNRNRIYCTVQYTCSLSPFIPVYKNNTGVQFHSKHLRAILQCTYKQSHTRHFHSNYSPFKQSCFLTLQ